MEDKRRKEVVLCTLRSYVGKSFKNNIMNEQQKAAILRLSNMREERFEQLCLDLTNDIQRRSGLSYEQPSTLGEKLYSISDQKFKSLVMETLTVFYIRNNEFRDEEMPEFLETLNSLICKLKTQTEKDIFINSLEGLSFYNKVYEFLNYVEKKAMPEEVIAKMKQIVNHEVKGDSSKLINAIEFPELFLDALEKSNVFEEHIKTDLNALIMFQEHKDRIKTAMTTSGMDLSSRSTVIKQNTKDILNMFIENIAVPSKKIEYFENEITGVVEVLEAIEQEVQNKKQMDLQLIAEKLSGIIEEIITKGTDLPSEHIKELNLQKDAVKTINSASSRKASFLVVIDIAKDIRKVLACI